MRAVLARYFYETSYFSPRPSRVKSCERAEQILITKLLLAARNLTLRMAGATPAVNRQLIRKNLRSFIDLGNRLTPDELMPYIRILEAAVSAFNPRTAEHQRRVSEGCLFVSSRLDLSIPLVDIETAARLHDFGKLGWPKRFFSVGREEAERLIPAHLFLSLYFLEEIEAFRPAAQIVRYNHAYDGYPDECRPEEMPLAAQVLSAVDLIDALVHGRAYRNGASFKHMSALQKLDARGYDPRLKQLIRDNIDRF